MRPDKFLQELIFPSSTHRTKQIFSYNPTVLPIREEAKEIVISVYDYNAVSMNEYMLREKEECYKFIDTENITWINVDGLRKSDVESICKHFGIHTLIVEDILSVGQRPKMDDIEGILYCLLNMLYFNQKNCTVEQEQISIILGKSFVITFQEDAKRDVFDGVRDKLRMASSKLRQRGSDYLCYSLLDMIVDHYYVVMEQLGDKIEELEDDITRKGDKKSLVKINNLRKELIVLKRNVSPVRDLVSGFMRSENELLQESTVKYFKDVYDHIIQANDFAENYRDMMMTLQDLYLSQVNLKMNEVMKVIAIVTCLLAPATVIGGIFGMNFDIIPYSHQKNAFYATVGVMVLIAVIMIIIFKKRKWF